jgi:mannose-6-phosphate isomerase-like protein (cupin superfamily)
MSFVRRKEDAPVQRRKLFDGAGEAEMHVILTGADEMYGKGRLFNHLYLEPGAEVGWHIHHGDSETYYILRGHGEYSDNGTLVEIKAGDTTLVGDGEGHSLKNTGDETLEAIAMILYTT